MRGRHLIDLSGGNRKPMPQNYSRQRLPRQYLLKMICLALFGVAFGYVEASVVVYLRELFYPQGFAFPLAVLPDRLIIVELFRELATFVMLLAVAAVLGERFWERFGYFIILFGIWDIFYYVWLKATIGWPATLLDWDILFLIPLPWIGPVIAPVLISALMIAIGLSITRLYERGYRFSAPAVTWVAGVAATLLILYSFMRDTDATLREQMPQPYPYWLLCVGLLLYLVGYVLAYRRAISGVADRTASGTGLTP
jgi:hypothetical protein